MKITNDMAFDMLPYVMDGYEKIDINKCLKDKKFLKITDAKTRGNEIMKYTVKNMGKVKEEVYNIVAIIEGKEVEEIAKQNFFDTIKAIKELSKDKKLIDFFKTAIE